MKNEKSKVLVAEDEDGIRKAISIYSQQAGLEPVCAANGKEGLELFEQHPDISCTVVDIMMPKMDGLQMVESIRKNSDIPVLFLSAKSQDIDKIQGFNSGGDDYLTKPYSSIELIARVKSLLRRYAQLQEARNQHKDKEEILYLHGLEMNVSTREVLVSDNPVHLTPKEFSILELLIRSPGRVYSPEQIYEQVWKEPAISTDTVTVHIRRLREKIEPDPKSPQFIAVVWGVGYKAVKE